MFQSQFTHGRNAEERVERTWHARGRALEAARSSVTGPFDQHIRRDSESYQAWAAPTAVSMMSVDPPVALAAERCEMGSADKPPHVCRAISGSTLAMTENFMCPICMERLIDAVTTECGHSFCRHCISTVFGQHATSFKEDERLEVPC